MLTKSNLQWFISLVADGAYDIAMLGHLVISLTVWSGDKLLAGQRGTTWNFDRRGIAYVLVFPAQSTPLSTYSSKQSRKCCKRQGYSACAGSSKCKLNDV